MIFQTIILFISGVEIVFVVFIALMLFGADKLPEIARELGKGMRTIKNATNDIKNEITKSSNANGIDTSIVQDIKKEIEEVKENINEVSGTVKRNL